MQSTKQMSENAEENKVERLPTYAFGYEFTHLPEHARDDVFSLEREGVLYSDQWVDELNDFRHVRIALTPDEVQDYARRTWAFELFLRAGCPTWARDVTGIDPDVARDADSHSLRVNPLYHWHCFAAFLGPHLESISCGGVPERRTIIELQGKESVLFTLKRAIQALTPTIRSFNAREKGLTPWPVGREDDVRDLLYVMLRPSLFDLVKEEPTPPVAQTYKFVDLCSKASRMLIEVKWIGRQGYWKTVLNQIRIDIQCYPIHPSCDTLVFVIVDGVRDVPDPRLVENEMSGEQVVLGRRVDVRVFVVEP